MNNINNNHEDGAPKGPLYALVAGPITSTLSGAAGAMILKSAGVDHISISAAAETSALGGVFFHSLLTSCGSQALKDDKELAKNFICLQPLFTVFGTLIGEYFLDTSLTYLQAGEIGVAGGIVVSVGMFATAFLSQKIWDRCSHQREQQVFPLA